LRFIIAAQSFNAAAQRFIIAAQRFNAAGQSCNDEPQEFKIAWFGRLIARLWLRRGLQALNRLPGDTLNQRRR
jgi:hypothetical protein